MQFETPPDPTVKIEFTREEAEALSLSLSDLLCWHQGFAAARDGTSLESHMPYGIEAVRTINLKLKRVY